MIRKVIFWLHLVIGLSAGLIIFVMAVTGILMSFEKQIISVAEGKFRVPASAGSAAETSVEAVITRVHAFDSSALPTQITVSADPAEPVKVSYGKERMLLAHPQTGEVLGEGAVGLRHFFETVVGIHRWLAMEGDWRPVGKGITGVAGLVFLALLFSGLILWLPRRWRLANFKVGAVPRFRLRGKARDWNWHNVIGFWLSPVILIVTVTGIIISYQWASNLLFRLAGDEPPAPRKAVAGPPREAGSQGPVKLPALDGLDAALAAASAKVPGWKVASFRLPGKGNAPLDVRLDRGGRGVRPDLITEVSTDLKTGGVLGVKTFDQNKPGQKLRMWARFAHTGELAGLPGQALAGLSAAGTALLVWTGFALSFRRFFRRRAASAVSENTGKIIFSNEFETPHHTQLSTTNEKK